MTQINNESNSVQQSNATAVPIPASISTMTPAQRLEMMKSNRKLIEEAMGNILVEGEQYGSIPGMRKDAKPILYKAGADVLCSLFQLCANYEYQQTPMENGHREYLATCIITDRSGFKLGEGVGLASTMETKYRYRKGGGECPVCGVNAIRKSKQEYGGGWYCNSYQGGCGEKFKAGDPQIENQNMGRMEHDNPADYYNTCLKMAAKRAQVLAVLTVTGVSSLFSQGAEVEAKQTSENVYDGEYETEYPFDNDNSAPHEPTDDDLMAELMEKSGLTVEEDIDLLKKFIHWKATSQKKSAGDILEASLRYFDRFTASFQKWLSEATQNQHQKSAPTNAQQDSTTTPWDDLPETPISDETLKSIGAELKRIGQPENILPEETVKVFKTADPRKLTEEGGKDVLQFLKSYKK